MSNYNYQVAPDWKYKLDEFNSDFGLEDYKNKLEAEHLFKEKEVGIKHPVNGAEVE